MKGEPATRPGGQAGLARRIAESALGGAVGLNDEPELAHVTRVVEAVLPEVRCVAWLHEILEHSSLDAADLLIAGFAHSEVAAVELLTRDAATDSDSAYLTHVAAIARAPGRAGRLARQVKTADLWDRMHNPRLRSNGWIPPYAEALHLLESGGVAPRG